MKIPLIYNVRSVLQRPVSTGLHRAGHRARGGGLRRHARAGQRLRRRAHPHRLGDDNVLVLRRGADAELSSGISPRRGVSIIAARRTLRPAPTDARW